jgi:5'-deoxynucleotidase YfbR-like HD superfamily hydrolase
MQLNDYISKYSVLRNIKRFSMESVIHPQDLCGHGYSVGTLFYLICYEFMIPIEIEDLFVAMNHDFVETYTGDINRKVKETSSQVQIAWSIMERRIVPEHLQRYTDEEISKHFLRYSDDRQYSAFLMADAYEAYLYTREEIEKGNSKLNQANEYYMKETKRLFSLLIERTNIRPILDLF